jgi:hypothetical protein
MSASFIWTASGLLKESHYIPLRKVDLQMASTSAKWERPWTSGTKLQLQNSLEVNFMLLETAAELETV